MFNAVVYTATFVMMSFGIVTLLLINPLIHVFCTGWRISLKFKSNKMVAIRGKKKAVFSHIPYKEMN